MKTDEKLLLDVSNALKSELLTANCDIGVASKNGTITLMGAMDYYIKKTDAEQIAKEVTGIKSVVNKIDVRLNSWEEKKDLEITAKILNAFRWNWNTLNDTIKVNVTNGWVTLTGALAWNYQKEAAKEAITNLMGVKGVSNNIIIQSQKDVKIEKTNLINALQNHLALDSQHIEIVVLDSNITLKGTVNCWFQKELAGRIAWKTPGVVNVDNELMIEEK